jgi:carboxyl-terminal processing protease
MPRRNLHLLLAVAVVSLVCYLQKERSRYGHALVDVLHQIERRYLEPVDGATLFEGAVEGMVGRLDEHSAYISPKNLPEFNETISRQFVGVGMEIAIEPKSRQLMVVAPLAGSPAWEAGIRAGDKILSIDGLATQGIAIKDAERRIRGKPGSPVTLSLLHEGEKKPVELSIMRAVIHADTVLGDTRRADSTWNWFLAGYDRIGYLRINSFAENTEKEMAAALDRLAANRARGVILDLRNNPGGLLEAGVSVADMFLDSGVIVTTRSRGGRVRQTYSADGKAILPDVSMAILVNQYTASAAEIVAACLQDHGRAVIVGQRTYGKGTVQELIDLEENQGLLKLTTASYWRPSGRDISRPKNADADHDWGVTPNRGFEVSLEGEELARWFRWRAQRDTRRPSPGATPRDEEDPRPQADAALMKAVDYIEQATGKAP